MTYKIDPAVKRIQSPILLKTDETESGYENGEALAEASFPKRYEISAMTAEDSRIVIRLKERKESVPAELSGRTVSLFDGD